MIPIYRQEPGVPNQQLIYPKKKQKTSQTSPFEGSISRFHTPPPTSHHRRLSALGPSTKGKRPRPRPAHQAEASPPGPRAASAPAAPPRCRTWRSSRGPAAAPRPPPSCPGRNRSGRNIPGLAGSKHSQAVVFWSPDLLLTKPRSNMEVETEDCSWEKQGPRTVKESGKLTR